tara:strand:- start:13934 stop:14101 length:168 start_codon:yes stop_codon:yes gene_type:complete
MTQEQKDLLIELVRVERRRLHGLRLEFSSDSNEQKKIWIEIHLCNSTLLSLKGGK